MGRPDEREARRLTTAALMAIVAVTSLVALLVTPLFRFGVPACMGPHATAVWLLSRPGSADCLECHATPVAVLDRLDLTLDPAGVPEHDETDARDGIEPDSGTIVDAFRGR